jgi:D-amino peptidase
MKVLIAADMEGISGVVHWDQVDPQHPEYARFRRIMTGDVNAAIRGAFEGGADEVLVTDGHDEGRNLLIEDLDPRARLNAGTPKRLAMVEGVDSGVEGVIFIGYHARAGAPSAILDHTWSSTLVTNVWLNGQLVGETGLNGAVCGHFNTPVIMISGDQSVCAEATALIGNLETAIVKQAHGRMSAECLPISIAQQKIQAAAAQAVARLRAGQAPAPLRLQTPVTVRLEFAKSEMADKAMILAGARRGPDRQIEYIADDMVSAYFAFRALVAVAR